MIKLVCFEIFLLCALLAMRVNASAKCPEVVLHTNMGDITVELYDDTPLHRDNFLNNVLTGYYNGKTFNRVIADFVVQCGEEELEDVVPAEICYPKHYHKRGALAMGRCTDDTERLLKSSRHQFYIVWGNVCDKKRIARAKQLMHERSYGRCKMNKSLERYYANNPGLPSLDGSYTVFGEVKSGLEIVERIQSAQTDSLDRPLDDIVIINASIKDGGKVVDWIKPAASVDAFGMCKTTKPSISCFADSVYTIHDWYGVKGYDLKFKTKFLNDSLTINVVNAESYNSGYYYVKTGLDDLPIATVYPGMFVETSTICSGFTGNEEKGMVWAYVYLYSPQRQWKGGHLYKLWWGEQPPQPIWRVEGKCSLVGNVPDITATLEAYADGRYILRNWYGVDKYDLEFRVLPNGGIDVLDYYWVENGCRYVQCRRDDIGSAAILASDSVPNGGMIIDGNHGRLFFKMIAISNDDKPIADNGKNEFVFSW